MRPATGESCSERKWNDEFLKESWLLTVKEHYALALFLHGAASVLIDNLSFNCSIPFHYFAQAQWAAAIVLNHESRYILAATNMATRCTCILRQS
jgi:hypothetical protein